MNRTPYRRVMPSRLNSGDGGSYPREYSAAESGDQRVSHGEALILQCIICGIIMVFVLVAGMVDIAPAAQLRDGMRHVLSGAETLDELVLEVRRFGHEWLDWAPPPETVATPEEFYLPEIDNPYPAYNLEQTIFPYGEPLSDNPYPYGSTNTEILPPAADQQVSNPTVPEPPVTPGLWD